jgi:predicted permease
MVERWLPAEVRRELFEPARQDLRIRELARAHGAGAFARRLSALRLHTAIAVLYVQCWWTVLVSGVVDLGGIARGIELRQAFRLLSRERALAAAVVLTLTLGVGANAAVFAVVEAVLLRPLGYQDADDLIFLNHRDERSGRTKDNVAMGDVIDMAVRQSTLEHLVAFTTSTNAIYGFGDPIPVSVLQAEPAFFETFRLRVSHGRNLDLADARTGAAPAAVISDELWRQSFSGDASIVGRLIRVGQTDREVVGIAQAGFKFPAGRATDLIVPMVFPENAATLRNNGWILATGRRKPGVTLDQVNADLRTIAEQLEREHPRTNQGTRYFALSLRDRLIGDTRQPLTLLLGAVGLVLLIACVNVGNLLLARSLGRRHEQAIRVALGAGRGRLIGHALAESLVLAGVAGVAGIAVAYWATPALVALVPQSVRAPGLTDAGINWRVLAYTLAISVISALAFGLMSVLAGGRPDAMSLTAPARAGTSARARRAASWLVVGEIALAAVLLIGAGLIVRSFIQLMAVDPGFRIERVQTLDIALPAGAYRQPEARVAFYRRVFDALGAAPDVQVAGAAVVTPLTGNNWTVPFERTDRPTPAGDRPPDVGWQLASGGYFEALEIPLRSGRLFDSRDGPAGAPVVIVSEALERRFFSTERAVGHFIKLGDTKAEIVGVVGNIRRAGLTDEPRADMYFPFEHEPAGSSTLFLRTASDPSRVLPAVRQALRSIEPNLSLLQTTSLRQTAMQSVGTTRLAMWLLGGFALLALALAAVGIYAVTAALVRQRTREIGTRLALGARPADIAWLVLRRGALLGLAGVALGLGAGLVAARSLRTLLYGVDTWDPRTLTLAACVLVTTSIAASYWPARRAAKTDPARTLTGN